MVWGVAGGGPCLESRGMTREKEYCRSRTDLAAFFPRALAAARPRNDMEVRNGL